jgi:predicted nucleic acid-binding protein
LIVLDASAALELLLNSRRGRTVATRIASPQLTLHAPHLIDLEVCQALRRYLRAETLGATRAETVLDLLSELDLTRYPHEPLLPRIWQLRANLTAYDGAYVALTEALCATLLTCDERLARAAGSVASVEVIG